MHFTPSSIFFFFNDTATTEIYTLSLHDALPISFAAQVNRDDINDAISRIDTPLEEIIQFVIDQDRKSTRLNSSHQIISYAVFCLKKKKRSNTRQILQHHTQVAIQRMLSEPVTPR